MAARVVAWTTGRVITTPPLPFRYANVSGIVLRGFQGRS
jgi:hypothetical protein